MKSSAVAGIVAVFVISIGVGLRQAHAAVEFGALTIQSQPDVEVIWDGVPLGSTDAAGKMVIGNIPPGTYTLTFSSSGFTIREESVDITPGPQRLDATLVVQADVGAGLAPAHLADAPVDEDIAQAPGPKPQDYLLTTAFLVVVAVLVLTAFLLADRRSRRQRAAAKPQGPRIVVQGSSEPTKKLPTFYADLKRRETDLEDLVDAGSGRSRRQVIDIEVEDHGPVEDDQ